jgi:hypothetical protein
VTACAIAPDDKRAVARNVGKYLVGLYGKRKSYAPGVIKSAMRKQRYSTQWDCWAISLFASEGDFDAYHAAIGETCNYAAMRGEMLEAIHPAPGADFGNGSAADFLGDLFDFVT